MNDPDGPIFVDTNVWLYALIDGTAPRKSEAARELLTRQSPTLITSTQVINEICVNLI